MVLLERASTLKTIVQIGAIDEKTRALAHRRGTLVNTVGRSVRISSMIVRVEP